MSHYANYADVIDKKKLKMLCPKTYKVFKQELSAIEGQIHSQAIVDLDIHEGIPESFEKALYALQLDFNGKTRLSITLMHHEAEERGDTIDGFFFHVDDFYILNPVARSLQKYINREFWVTYG